MSIKTYSFKNIKEYLLKFSIVCDSNLQDSEVFTNLNSISESDKNDLIFFNDSRYLDLLKNNNAKACLISSDNKDFLPATCEPIIVDDPYLAFTYLTNLFFKQIQSNGIISKFVDLSKKATIETNVQINNFSVLKENVFLDKNVLISENCVIGPNVSIGKNTFIGPNTFISNTKIGNYCIIKSNLSIGGRGFGFATKEKVTFQHFGNVLIGDDVHIGSNTCIDRAAFGSTVIESGSRLDNLIQIAHNVIIGKNAVIAANVGIAGSTTIGDNVIIGGQAGISGHLQIGKDVTIAAKSGVTKNIKDNSVVAGFPAIDIKKWKKNIINFNKL
tara:strand:- start:670 stop:1656 length:987 start_codon:yes stop_codon:yes gene_type:complete